MQPFEERKRDPFITEEAYQVCLGTSKRMFTDPTFAENRDQIKKLTKDFTSARRVSSYRSMSFIEEPWVRYSAGDTLEDLRDRVKYAFEDLQRHIEAFPEDDYKLWEPDAYYYTMMLTSWSVLFNLPECFTILAAYVSRDPEDGEDSFIYTLFSALGIHDFPGKQAGLLHEDPYGILYDSLAGSKEDQQNAMKAYLKRWYKSEAIRGCYWCERHAFNPPMHLGYWAFETGLLTVLNDLDDSGYREMNFYPRDMVDYCKAQGWAREVRERVQAMHSKP